MTLNDVLGLINSLHARSRLQRIGKRVLNVPNKIRYVYGIVYIVHVYVYVLYVCFMCLQLFKRRAKYLKGKEKNYWSSLDPSFMSEESAHESEGELVMHKHTPVYRSEG